jgi:hypothetical protein
MTPKVKTVCLVSQELEVRFRLVRNRFTGYSNHATGIIVSRKVIEGNLSCQEQFGIWIQERFVSKGKNL